MEKECKLHGITEHVKRSDGGVRCKKCASDAVQKRREKIKIMALEYKGGKCEICGYDRCVRALEFHHKDPTKKDFGIAHKGRTRSWEKVKTELDKCMLVCSNCHAEIHEKIIQPLI
jgi:hypothetical protein